MKSYNRIISAINAAQIEIGRGLQVLKLTLEQQQEKKEKTEREQRIQRIQTVFTKIESPAEIILKLSPIPVNSTAELKKMVSLLDEIINVIQGAVTEERDIFNKTNSPPSSPSKTTVLGKLVQKSPGKTTLESFAFLLKTLQEEQEKLNKEWIKANEKVGRSASLPLRELSSDSENLAGKETVNRKRSNPLF